MLPTQCFSHKFKLSYRLIPARLCMHCKVIYDVLKFNSKKHLQHIKIVKPKGCYCQEFDLTLIIYHGRKQIGNLELHQIVPKVFETHSNLDIEYQGQKIGLWMYSVAADWAHQHGFKLVSAPHHSSMAARLWRSKTWRKYYHIIPLTILGYKRFRVKPKAKLPLFSFEKITTPQLKTKLLKLS